MGAVGELRKNFFSTSIRSKSNIQTNYIEGLALLQLPQIVVPIFSDFNSYFYQKALVLRTSVLICNKSPLIGVHFFKYLLDRLQILMCQIAFKTRALNHSTTPPGKNY